MPVRSLNSSVLKWPDQQEVHEALLKWVKKAVTERPGIRAVGYFGSYARGDWGFGSDLDLIVVLADATEPFGRRQLSVDVLDLPVGVDRLVYTRGEWESLIRSGSRFARTVAAETVWVYTRENGEEPEA
ncbi:MAG: nucleotidyltransferase domain-containing protein [Bacteroidota bacterium]